MVFFNHATRQMTAKIVYYGPGLCGKTTNLSTIYEKTAQKARGEMVSLNTETDRTLFFDLLPLDVGIVGGFKAKLQLYTVPGQVFYNSTRKLVLKGVDGIVFVADSQSAMLDANRESIQNLTENLKELGLNILDIPMVFQWNKRDLKQIVPLDVLQKELNPRQLVSFPAIAMDGTGVFETLRGITRLALTQIKRLHLADRTPQQPLPPIPEVAPPQVPVPAQVAPPPSLARVVAPEPAPGGGWAQVAALSATPRASDPDLASNHLPSGLLPEALSFLDLSSALDLFNTTAGGEPASVPNPALAFLLPPDEASRVADGVKAMAPLVVRPLPPQPVKAPTPAANGTAAMPRPTFKPFATAPVPRLLPAFKALLPLHPGAPRPGAAHAPGLQVLLPADTDGQELDVQVLVRRNGLVVAQVGTTLTGPGAGAAALLSVQFKRS